MASILLCVKVFKNEACKCYMKYESIAIYQYLYGNIVYEIGGLW